MNPGNASTKLIRSYPELASELVGMISSARREIYLASRYYEPLIGGKLLTKFMEGVSVNILDGNSSGISFEQRILEAGRYLTENRNAMREFLESPKVKIRSCKLDYSFIVIDGRECGFEVLNPASPDEFNFAIELDDTEVATNLIGIYQALLRSERVSKRSGDLEESMSKNELSVNVQ